MAYTFQPPIGQSPEEMRATLVQWATALNTLQALLETVTGGSLTLDTLFVNEYIELNGVTAPAAPTGTDVRIYSLAATSQLTVHNSGGPYTPT